MASTYLQRTMGTPTNNKKWTLSFWIKKSSNDANPYLFTAYNSSQTDNRSWINWQGDNTMSIAHYNVSSYTWRLVTNRLFRDLNAWYHIVVATDTTQATASDRVKLYINGVQETSFSTETYPSQNYDPQFNSAQPFRVGQAHNNTNYFDGSMAHVHLIDGTAYDASYFGLTDATTGIWQPKSYSGSYGTNGFFLKFENSASFGTDSSGNGNNFTVNGTMTQTIDTPSNVFATLNPLQNLPSANTYSQGNNTVTYTVHNDLAEATLGMTSGKYYWEQKFINTTGGNNAMIGVGNENAHRSAYVGADTTGWSYYAVNGTKYHNGSTSSYGATFTAGDIIGVAFDADTRTIWFSKNGTWQNSATISEIGAGTTTNSAYTGMGSAGDLFLPVTSGYNGNVISWNFGNGFFGTTAVSSAENPDDGIGIFEYEVPTGYKALCTKSINAQEYS
jgi:hypothetical protein